MERREHIPFRAKEGAHERVLSFARLAARMLVPAFGPPPDEHARETESVPYEHERTRLRFGDAGTGFEVELLHEHVEAGAITLSADTIRVQAYGLGPGASLRVVSVRAPNHPSFLGSIAVEVEGAADRVSEVLEAFDAAFAHERLDAAELDTTVRVARGYLRPPMWADAGKWGALVLARRPDDLEARMVLGIACAAQGQLDEAEQHLGVVTERAPEHVDAWYNLGCVHLARKRPADAARCLRRALAVDPANHPSWFMLGRALEESGESGEALRAYASARGASPNPGQAFHFTGLDFTQAADEAIRRLGG